jgi:hypothetical protein
MNKKMNWLVTLTAIVIFSFFSTGTVQAWGPLAQSAIAQAASDADGMPPITANRNFVIEATMPKVFEYTDHAYAKLSYDFTDIMADNVHGMTDYCQMLSWGASQSAEKTGDFVFFHRISVNTFERWVNELFSDALLFAIDSPYYNTARSEVAVMPKLVSDTSVEYTDAFGGDSIRGLETVGAAYYQSFVLIGEMAVINNENFQANAKRNLNTAQWMMAMGSSVDSAVEFVIDSTQAQTSNNWFVSNANDYGARLLHKIGSILVATGDAAVSGHHQVGVYYYRSQLVSPRVNEITLDFLYGVSRDLDEDPIMRHLAVTLYDLMTINEIDFSAVVELQDKHPRAE